MKRIYLCILAAAAVLATVTTSCSLQQPKEYVITDEARQRGDSTLYGMVCYGTTDSILVFLREPYDGSDPDTLDILRAMEQQRVFGEPHIGDRVAMMLCDTDSTQASSVIVTQALLGQWCYRVTPTLRHRPGHDSLPSLSPDSLSRLLSEEREYGFSLKIDSIAMPIGISYAPTTEDSPIEYPSPRLYRRWHISNGHLLLTLLPSDSTRAAVVDSTDIVRLTSDSLILRMADGDHHFYKREE